MVACSAYRCESNSTKKEAGVTFYRFPNDPVRRKLWVERTKLLGWTPLKTACLCSKHFEESFFYATDLQVNLHDDAIPTIFSVFPSYLQPIPKKGKKRTFENVTQAGPSTSQSGRLTLQARFSKIRQEDIRTKRQLRRQLDLVLIKSRDKSKKLKVLEQTLKLYKKQISSMQSIIENWKKNICHMQEVVPVTQIYEICMTKCDDEKLDQGQNIAQNSENLLSY